MTTKNLKLPPYRAPRTPEDLHAEALLLRWGVSERKLKRESIAELAEVFAAVDKVATKRTAA